MPIQPNLTERTDEAAKMSLQMVETMVQRVFEMRRIRDQTVEKRKNELKRIDKKYTNDIIRIEKDIYNFENAIKQLTSAKEFYAIKKRYKDEFKTDIEEMNSKEEVQDGEMAHT